VGSVPERRGKFAQALPGQTNPSRKYPNLCRQRLCGSAQTCSRRCCWSTRVSNPERMVGLTRIPTRSRPLRRQRCSSAWRLCCLARTERAGRRLASCKAGSDSQGFDLCAIFTGTRRFVGSSAHETKTSRLAASLALPSASPAQCSPAPRRGATSRLKDQRRFAAPCPDRADIRAPLPGSKSAPSSLSFQPLPQEHTNWNNTSDSRHPPVTRTPTHPPPPRGTSSPN
jgi:hypothetical protein